MDRRSFLGRASGLASDVIVGPGFEYMPGRFADDRLPIRWTDQPPPREATTGPNGTPLDTTTGLEPYVPTSENPWDRRRAIHLLRRTGYGADPDAIDAVLSGAPDVAVNAIIDAALAAPLPPTPPWIDEPVPPPDAPQSELDAFIQANTQWIYDTEGEVHNETLSLLEAGTAFRERLALFWHNHFVTGIDSYFLAAWLYRYWTLSRTHALGNFKQFVHEIGITPAMLVYLNGIQNQVGDPNENYGRELLELFTMGIEYPEGTPNYTQDDIEELARVLTGWTVDLYGTLEAVFIPEWHDEGIKTVFGQTGNWGYDDVVPLLFGQRSEPIAHFVADKLYREFVYAIPDSDVVGELADLLLANDFELEPAVRTLLKSAHFFDDQTIGAQIKSPLDTTLGLVRETGFTITPDVSDLIRIGTRVLTQQLFQPPNVAGWPGYHSWLDTNTLPVRWLYADIYLPKQQTLQALALSMPNPFQVELLAADLAEFFLAVPFDEETIITFTEILLNGIPPYEWNPNDPGAEGRLFGLVSYILELPEYQLN